MKHCSNPPWSDKILSNYWAALEKRVGAAWMPVARRTVAGLGGVRAQVAELQASVDRGMADEYWLSILQASKARLAKLEKAKPKGYEEFGCGHYGCVMPTQTPGVVIKVTTDATEAAFVAAYLSLPRGQRPVGIIPYLRILAVRGESRLKRPVFILWRAEAQHLGVDGIRKWITEQRPNDADYYGRSLKKATALINTCLDAARDIRQRVHNKPDAAQVLAEAQTLRDAAFDYDRLPPRASRALAVAWCLNRFQQAADDLQQEPTGIYIGRALSDSLEAGLLLADVHLNNIGMPTGDLLNEIGMTPVVTDPGHAIALDDRYRGVQVEEL